MLVEVVAVVKTWQLFLTFFKLTLTCCKILDLDAKNLACHTENLVQNLISLVLASKSNRLNDG